MSPHTLMGQHPGSPAQGPLPTPWPGPGSRGKAEREGCVCPGGQGGADPREVKAGRRPQTSSHQLRDGNLGGEVPQREEEPTSSPPSHHFSSLSLPPSPSLPFHPSPPALSAFFSPLPFGTPRLLPEPGSDAAAVSSPGTRVPRPRPAPYPARPSGLRLSPRRAG